MLTKRSPARATATITGISHQAPAPMKMETNSGASAVPAPSNAFNASTLRSSRPGRELLRECIHRHDGRSETEAQRSRGDEQHSVSSAGHVHQQAAGREQRHGQQIGGQSGLENPLERPSSREARTQAGRENGQDDLRDEHHPVARRAEPEAVRAGEDGAGRRKCDQRQPLNEPSDVDQADFRRPAAHPRKNRRSRASARRCARSPESHWPSPSARGSRRRCWRRSWCRRRTGCRARVPCS